MASDDDGNTKVLPSGLVTFVFTDIEASTRLYKTVGQDTATEIFDLHNELLRTAWRNNDGHEIHTEGDSFFVAFDDPTDAVRACVEAQRLLAEADWPAGGNVRVRIGMHCGLAAPRHDDYMALAVHQAARVMSAANGNQILMTDAIVNRLQPIAGVGVTRVGAFRLRDFDESPALHRVLDATARTNDDPPRATPAQHHNLVPRLTSFVGRSADVVAVNGLLEAGKAVTVVGPGGMGKTRLAIEVGLEVAPTWADGVWMVELAEVVDPDLIPEEIAVAVGVDSSSVGDRWNDVLEFIGDKAMLLILDNAEHLIDECARLVPELLRANPHTAVLVTSREPLNCQGEVVYRVRSLELSFEVDDPRTLPSVELFLDRANAISANFEWTDNEITEVLEICRHLDGLPLALEIAAAQVRVLQLSEIRTGLDNRFRLLRSRDRALPERQRTMEGLLGWSYQLLSEQEQRAFRRLAVFGGSFSIDAAEAALAGDGIDADDVPELIWTLVDKSLIAADLSDSATRYRLFETVQQYALRLLIDTDDPLRSSHRLGEWLLAECAPWKPNDRHWLGQVALELANIRNVVDLAGDAYPEMAHQLMCSVGRYYDAALSYQTGIDELERTLERVPTETPSLVAVLAEIAHLCLRMANTDKALQLLDQARELHDHVGPPSWNDVAVSRVRGELAVRAGDYDEAIRVAQEALASSISAPGQARMWSIVGIAQCSSGRVDEGLASLQQALSIYVELGDVPQTALAHANVAEAAWRQDLFAVAARHQRHCLEDAIAIGQPLAVAASLTMAGYLAAQQGDWHDSLRMLSSASAMQDDAGHQPYEEEARAMSAAKGSATDALGAEVANQLIAEAERLSIFAAAELAFAIFDGAGLSEEPSVLHPRQTHTADTDQ